jgi:hypothetical protein
MSQMLADIKRIVNEDVSNRVTQYDVIFEAITNSVHANATKIACTLFTLEGTLSINYPGFYLGFSSLMTNIPSPCLLFANCKQLYIFVS